MKSVHTLIDQELAQFGWVESAATNTISGFKSQKSIFEEERTDTKNNDLIDKFICHLIFYFIFCYSILLHIVIDLGFGSFLVNKVTRLFRFEKREEIYASIPTLPIKARQAVQIS